MNVYSYFERDSSLRGFDHAIEVWGEWWAKVGYIPVILTEDDARKHPRFAEIEAHIRSIPTVNPPTYERACWLRWAAIEAIGGGLMVDLDVLPNPRKFHGLDHIATEQGVSKVLEPGSVPCAVIVAGTGDTLDILKNFTSDDCDTIDGRSHGSDMMAFKKAFPNGRNCEGVCIEFGSEGWMDSDMVHFATQSLVPRGFTKETLADAAALLKPDFNQHPCTH